MAGFLDDFRRRTPGLYWLLVLAVGGSVLGLVLDLVFPGASKADIGATRYLIMPADFWAFLKQPWSFFTQVLVTPITGSTLLSFIFNGVFIYQFGRMLFTFIGEKKVRAILIFAPQVITLFVLLIANVIGKSATENQYLFGLSGIAVTLMVAVATISPRYPVRIPIFGQIRVVWIVVVIVALKMLSPGPMNFFPEFIAIVGGALLGFGHIKMIQQGNDYFLDVLEWMEGFSEPKEKKPRMRVVYKREEPVTEPRGSRPPQASGPAPSDNLDPDEETINRILDRINEVGYEKLSRREKEILAGLSDREE